ncbi:hypothetical protein ACWCOP_07070 [Maricaulaceae bacterium MS644]
MGMEYDIFSSTLAAGRPQAAGAGVRLIVSILSFLFSLLGLLIAGLVLFLWTEDLSQAELGLKSSHWLWVVGAAGAVFFGVTNPFTSRFLGLKGRIAPTLALQGISITAIVGGSMWAVYSSPIDANYVSRGTPAEALCDVSRDQVFRYGSSGNVNWVVSTTASPIAICSREGSADINYSQYTASAQRAWRRYWESSEWVVEERPVIATVTWSFLFGAPESLDQIVAADFELRPIVGRLHGPDFITRDALYETHVVPIGATVERHPEATDEQHSAYEEGVQLLRFMSSNTFVRVDDNPISGFNRLSSFDRINFVGEHRFVDEPVVGRDGFVESEDGYKFAIANEEWTWSLDVGLYGEDGYSALQSSDTLRVDLLFSPEIGTGDVLVRARVDMTGLDLAIAEAKQAYREVHLQRW